MNYNYLPQYKFGTWLKENAGTIGTVAGTGLGAVVGGPVGATIGASLGSQIGGNVQQNYEQDQAAERQANQMAIMQNQQNYQNRLNMANQNFYGNKQSDYAGTQNFANGGDLPDVKYNQKLPHKSSEGQDYFITRRTVKTMQNPDLFKPFTDNYVVFTDPKLVPEYGNVRGYGINKEKNNIYFNADSSGDSSMFKNAFKKQLSIQELMNGVKGCGGYLKKMGNGGSMGYSNGSEVENYTGQTHDGPDGGIEVDQNGVPTSMSNEEGVGIVEDNEVSWKDPKTGKVYIFSDRLKI